MDKEKAETRASELALALAGIKRAITKLNKDPGSKARKLASFAKGARAKFVA